jgi:hypothetical protein
MDPILETLIYIFVFGFIIGSLLMYLIFKLGEFE